MWVGGVLFWQDVLQPCFSHKWASSATPASFCSSWFLSSLPVELSSRHGVNTGLSILIWKPLCYMSQNSGSTNPLSINVPEAHPIVVQLIWAVVKELRLLVDNSWGTTFKIFSGISHTCILPYTHWYTDTNMNTYVPHIYTNAPAHTFFYAHVYPCRKKKKHAHRNLNFCCNLWRLLS